MTNLVENIDNLFKSDLLGKSLTSLITGLSGSCSDNNECEALLRDRITLFDLTVCDACLDVVDACDDIRYEGYDFTFSDERQFNSKYNEFSMCDCCFDSDKNSKLLVIN